MKSLERLYDDHHTRYQLVKSNKGNTNFNWLFIPGGPGADSCYFLDLIKECKMPGHYWLIDFPANGNNISDKIPAEYNFDQWNECLLHAVRRFDNPVIVGHSFGGMFPLLFPELENMLSGFIILNSAPSLWVEEATKAKAASGVQAPGLVEALEALEQNPNQETFKKALLACAPYYFTENLEKGKELISQLPFNYYASAWWLKKVKEINYTAKWVPENINTLIIGASQDYITPFTLFEKDKRFCRNNVTLKKIENAGHFPWVEQMPTLVNHFHTFADQLPN